MDELYGRTVRFMPLAALDPGDQSRRVPHTVNLVAGMLRYRPMRDADVVQTHRLEVGWSAAKLYRRSEQVQFLHIDGVASLATGSDSYWRLFRRGYHGLENRYLANTRDVVVFNQSGADRLRQMHGHVRFSPTWFDPELCYPAESRPAAGRILWCGRIESPKDPLLAVETMRRLPHHTLTVLGEGTLRPQMEAAVAARGLADRVSFAGAVSKERVGEVMRGHDLLLMTSHYEGFPRSLVEALACGLPVVTTQGGEPNGLVRTGLNGGRAETRDPDELAELVDVAQAISVDDVIRSVRHLDARVVVPYVLDSSMRLPAPGL